MAKVALLRGINVGGANALPMAELKALCARLGWHDVQSYVASGNLVFDAEGTPEALSERLEQALRETHGLEVPVLVLDGETLRAAHAGCPFVPDDPRQVHLCFLYAAPDPDLALYEQRKAEGDGLEIGEGVAWLHTPGGFGRSKLAAELERLLGTQLTARNLRSVARLVEMLDARA